jgi:uncharacterized small protein (DUF1192 family)
MAYILENESEVVALRAEVQRLREDLWVVNGNAEAAIGLFERTTLANAKDRDNLNTRIAQLEADVERIGRERDDMARAAAELQARLTACEGVK